MSWWIETIGAPLPVKAIVDADTNVPKWIKDGLNSFGESIPPGNVISVHTSGHVTDPAQLGNSITLTVKVIQLAELPPTPPTPTSPTPS